MERTKATVKRFPAVERREGKQRRPFNQKEITKQTFNKKLLTLKKWSGNKNKKNQD